MKRIFLGACILFALVAHGEPSGFSVDKHGVLTIGDTHWQTFYQDQQWKASTQQKSLRVDQSASNFTAGPITKGISLSGDFQSDSGADLFAYELQFKPDGKQQLRVDARMQASQPVTANNLMYDGRLPAKLFAGREITVDGQTVALPVETPDNHVLLVKQARELKLPVEGGLTIDASGIVMIVDNRKFGGKDFSVRLAYNPHKGEISRSQFRATFDLQPLRQAQLSLKSVANRALKDDVADDGRGGWTDQGPDNDLRAFKPDSKLTTAADFDLNFDGNAALVLSQKPGRANLINARVTAPRDLAPAYLHMLHASAYTWGQVGLIKVTYADGEEQIIEVQAKRDVGNWWNPASLDNANVAWSGRSKEAQVGIYESRFALQSKPVREVAFAAAGEPTWMILGATLVEGDVPLPQPSSIIISANEDWAPIDLPLTIVPGSAFDFSDWTEAPAGQHGHVITTPDGHFAFADQPNKPVRFWGANINFGVNFLPKEQSKALAKRFRQMGYNSVRIHHYDVLLAGGWNSEEYLIDPEMLDRLDYLFACMKEEGLYISTDLFTIRRIHEPSVKAYDWANLAVFKALVPILPGAMDDWKRFARDLLAHKNPYTGMTWAEDPALVSIAAINEDTIWAALNSNREVRKLWDAKFEDWYRQQPNQSNDEAARATAFNQFLAEKQMASDAEMRRFLRDELGCQALVTGNNWKNYRAQTPIRAELEYVDNHGYWDHPSFPVSQWSLPYAFSQRSALQDRAEIPRRVFISRIDGLPFMVTEFNFVYPNQYRSEGGPLVGAYAGLQDWDGIYRFSWAHTVDSATVPFRPKAFDIAQEPIGLLGEHIIGMFFRRGDMPSFTEEAIYVVGQEEAFAGKRIGEKPREFPKHASLLGLTRRVGSTYKADADSESMNQIFHQEKPRSRYEAEVDGARVVLEAEGAFLAETLQSKAAIVQSKSLDEDFVRDVTGGPATIFAGAVDDQPLSTSKRVLILHLTNALASNMVFGEVGLNTVQELGELPVLVRRGDATIRIPRANGDSLKLYALDLAGNRVAEIPYKRDGDVIEFRAQTIADDGRTTLAYELTAN